MNSTAREYFTVDLRGLRPALKARAVRDGLTESDVLRSALAAALDDPRVHLRPSVIGSIDSPRMPRAALDRTSVVFDLDAQSNSAGRWVHPPSVASPTARCHSIFTPSLSKRCTNPSR